MQLALRTAYESGPFGILSSNHDIGELKDCLIQWSSCCRIVTIILIQQWKKFRWSVGRTALETSHSSGICQPAQSVYCCRRVTCGYHEQQLNKMVTGLAGNTWRRKAVDMLQFEENVESIPGAGIVYLQQVHRKFSFYNRNI